MRRCSSDICIPLVESYTLLRNARGRKNPCVDLALGRVSVLLGPLRLPSQSLEELLPNTTLLERVVSSYAQANELIASLLAVSGVEI